MLVGGLTIPNICPNDALAMSESGKLKFGWLKKLKNWSPTPSDPFSQCGIFVFFVNEKSVLK